MKLKNEINYKTDYYVDLKTIAFKSSHHKTIYLNIICKSIMNADTIAVMHKVFLFFFWIKYQSYFSQVCSSCCSCLVFNLFCPQNGMLTKQPHSHSNRCKLGRFMGTKSNNLMHFLSSTLNLPALTVNNFNYHVGS